MISGRLPDAVGEKREWAEKGSAKANGRTMDCGHKGSSGPVPHTRWRTSYEKVPGKARGHGLGHWLGCCRLRGGECARVSQSATLYGSCHHGPRLHTCVAPPTASYLWAVSPPTIWVDSIAPAHLRVPASLLATSLHPFRDERCCDFPRPPHRGPYTHRVLSASPGRRRMQAVMSSTPLAHREFPTTTIPLPSHVQRRGGSVLARHQQSPVPKEPRTLGNGVAEVRYRRAFCTTPVSKRSVDRRAHRTERTRCSDASRGFKLAYHPGLVICRHISRLAPRR